MSLDSCCEIVLNLAFRLIPSVVWGSGIYVNYAELDSLNFRCPPSRRFGEAGRAMSRNFSY